MGGAENRPMKSRPHKLSMPWGRKRRTFLSSTSVGMHVIFVSHQGTWLGLLTPELEQVLCRAAEGGTGWNPGGWWLNSAFSRFSSRAYDHPCSRREQLSPQAPQFQHPRLSLPITILKTPGTCPPSFPRLVYLCPATPLLCSVCRHAGACSCFLSIAPKISDIYALSSYRLSFLFFLVYKEITL